MRGVEKRSRGLPPASQQLAADDPLLSGPAMARILGVTEQRVRQLHQEVMPRAARGKYPLMACVQWYVRFWKARTSARKLDQLRKEGEQLRQQLRRIKVERANGTLVSKHEVVTV